MGEYFHRARYGRQTLWRDGRRHYEETSRARRNTVHASEAGEGTVWRPLPVVKSRVNLDAETIIIEDAM